jgi:TonB-linked SusC/RagA family outer membrane protein
MKKNLTKFFVNKTYWYRFISVFMVLLLAKISFAQNISVSGKISDSDGAGIPGATIQVKGTSIGVTSNLDGNYTISNVPSDATLVFSFVGFLSEEINVEGKTSINITLLPDLIGIDEVVVVGYGTQKKADLSSAIAVVNSKDIALKPVSTFEQSLQGMTSGVEVTGNRGAPGEGAVIRIRGVGTVNSTQPLIVIDGIPTDGTLSLDQSEVASVQILKDAAAAAIYGARGANGVIIVTTKRGGDGAPKINFEAYFGNQYLPKKLDMLNAEQYSKFVIEKNYNNLTKKDIPPVALDPENTKYNTDWQDEIFQVAPMQKYTLSYSGGNEKANYSISGGYLSQDGIMIATNFTKYHLRFNSDFDQKRNFMSFKFGESFSIYSSTKHGEPTAGPRSQIESAVKATPTMGVYIDPALGAEGGFIGSSNSLDGHDGANPVATAWTNNYTTDSKGATGNVYGGLEIIKGLNLITRFGIDYRNDLNTYFLKKPDLGSSAGIDQTTLNKEWYQYMDILMENTISYEKTYGKFFGKAIIGYSEEKRSDDWVSAQRKGFSDNTQEMPLSTGDPSTQQNSGRTEESALRSTFGRVELSYDSKYFLTMNQRSDGSSKFGDNFKTSSPFRSFSAAWRVSEESFMKNISILSDLKLRYSYGELGNQDIGNYKYEANLNSKLSYVFGQPETVVYGTAPSNYPNKNLQWEETKQTDVGLDLGLFENKLNFTCDYYKKNTVKMLIDVPIPTSMGFEVNPTLNTGEVLNRGVELGLSYKKFDGDFHYTIGGNFTTIHNEVLSIGGRKSPILMGRVENGNAICLTDVGYPIGSFYLYKADGLYKSMDEIAAMNVTDSTGKTWVYSTVAKPGDVRFVDKDKNGKLTSDDRFVVGSAIPKFVYGFTFSADYKGFDLNLFMQGVHGNKIYNEIKFWTEGEFGNWNGNTTTLNAYRAEDVTITTVTPEGKTVQTFYPKNTNTDVPRIIRGDPNKNALTASTRFLEDGSYLRIKSLTLGYTLPKAITGKINVDRLRVYVSGENLFTFTKYSGYDPEIGSNSIGDSGGPSNTVRGIDNGYYPQARSYMTGIQLTF